MSKREALGRYSLIISRLQKGPCNLQQIKDYLETQSEIQGYNYQISTRTFQRDLEDIRSLYHVDIQYNPSHRAYEIKESPADAANERMLEAFDIFHALHLSEGMSQYIHFENSKPKGTEYLFLILHAIKNKCMLRFDYQKFDDDQSHSRLVQPFALKEYKQRWYMLATEHQEESAKLFALDRIQDAEVTKKKFTYPQDFDVAQYFKYCFGIMHLDGEPTELVILSFTPAQGMYIKSLPMHHSQAILEDNEKELRISLWVHPTDDLLSDLMSYGNQVQVVAPASIRKALRQAHEAASRVQ